jgi:hypothetical protein
LSAAPVLTLFTAPKPFTNPHIAVIQKNAIHSWTKIGADVEILLLGDEAGMTEAANELGVHQVKEIARNASGTPLISSLFETARQQNDSPLLAYVNADILLFPGFLKSAKKTAGLTNKFLLIGQRWDLAVTRELDFTEGWEEKLKQECAREGKLHPPTGSDYFVYPRACFEKIPDFAIGRAGWDNWMIYQSRLQGWQTIDASDEIQIIHQNHDYSHLPGGQAHYRLPETDENIRLAGGRRTIFTLPDADWRFEKGGLRRQKWTIQRLVREFEIFPLLKLRSKPLAELTHVLVHPRKAYARLRALLRGHPRKQE